MARATRRTTRATSEQTVQPVQSSQSQSDSEPQNQPPARSQRAASRASRRNASGPAATTARRRLRSAKDAGSPLQALQNSSQPKRRKANRKALSPVSSGQSDDEAQAEAHAEAQNEALFETHDEVQVHEEVQELVEEYHTDGVVNPPEVNADSEQRNTSKEPSPEHDPGAGIFFQETRPEYKRGSEIFDQIRMRRELSFMTGLKQGPDFPMWMDELYRQVEAQYLINEVEPLKARISELEQRITLLEPLQPCVAELISTNNTLQTRCIRLDRAELELARCYKQISLTAEVEIDERLLDTLMGTADAPDADTNTDTDSDAEIDADSTHQPTVADPSLHPTVALDPPSSEPVEILHGSARAIALLKMLENHKRSDQPPQPEAIPKSPEAIVKDTPMVETPKQESFFGRVGKVLSAITSPFSSRAASSLSRTQPTDRPVFRAGIILEDSPSELALSLTPTPTPVGERRFSSRTTQDKKHRKAMMKAVVNSVRDSAEKDKAKAWAEKAVKEISKDASAVGSKRKRLEGGVKVGDLEYISGSKPWTSGGYGMDDDIFDLSDSDDAPAWAVLQNMVLEQESAQNPAKKAKHSHDGDMDKITSLNDSLLSSANDMPSSVFNSGGNSSSLEDLQPRSSFVGSSMFEITSTPKNPGTAATHQQNENVFKELDAQSPEKQSQAEKRAAFDRELRRNGHVIGSGTYCVPEDSDEEDDGQEDEMDSTLWTQQPPPAPTPAHASLPGTATEESSDTAAPLDPIDVQRAKLTKHTPAKPSRLREVHVPSPSLRSDAGNESMQSMIASPVRTNGQSNMPNGVSAIPDAEDVDIPRASIETVNTFINSTDGQAYLSDCSWDDPLADFSDVDA